MSGEKESQTDEKLKELEEVLQSYLTKSGLLIEPNIEANKYLKYSSNEIKSMTTEDLGVAAICLQQYSFHIQKMINHEIMVVNWCESNIRRTVAKYGHQFPTNYYLEKVEKVTAENPWGRRLADIKKEAQARVDTLHYLSNSIKSYAESFLELQRTRRGKYDR